MRVLLLFCAASLAFGQGTTPKPSAAEYPAHGQSGGIAIAAEYMVHSFGTGEQMFLAENYLVLEVALYPPKDTTVTVDLPHFGLRINGRKTLILAQPPSMAAATLNHPEWMTRPTMDIGAGPIGVGLGYPPNRAPFPGAPPPVRTPAPPRAPDADSRSGVEKTPVKATDVLLQTALPADPHRGPISGFVFFPFTGKTSSIKSLELVWDDAVLKLR
jgi:hypothetical protein